MNKNRLRLLLRKHEEGLCNEREKALLYEFYDKHSKLENDIDKMPTLSESDLDQQIKDEIYTQVIEKIRTLENQNVKRISLVYKIAAGLLLLASASYFLIKSTVNSTDQTEYALILKETKKGQKLTVQLPDGTIVRLNAGTQLSYPEQFGDTREVALNGEAFFEVTRNINKPFIVTSGETKTKVLGTSFNINAYQKASEVQISLVSGSVQVLASQDSILIAPGEQVIYDIKYKHLSARKVDLSNYLAWKEGKMIFEGTSLKEIAETLENWYGTTIEFESDQINNCVFHLSFNNLPLTQVLDQLALVSGTEYEFVGDDKVMIKGVGCEGE